MLWVGSLQGCNKVGHGHLGADFRRFCQCEIQMGYIHAAAAIAQPCSDTLYPVLILRGKHVLETFCRKCFLSFRFPASAVQFDPLKELSPEQLEQAGKHLPVCAFVLCHDCLVQFVGHLFRS